MSDKKYTCYRETQTTGARCDEWCKNANYCEKREVCSGFQPHGVNYLLCKNCIHTENMHKMECDKFNIRDYIKGKVNCTTGNEGQFRDEANVKLGRFWVAEDREDLQFEQWICDAINEKIEREEQGFIPEFYKDNPGELFVKTSKEGRFIRLSDGLKCGATPDWPLTKISLATSVGNGS